MEWNYGLVGHSAWIEKFAAVLLTQTYSFPILSLLSEICLDNWLCYQCLISFLSYSVDGWKRYDVLRQCTNACNNYVNRYVELIANASLLEQKAGLWSRLWNLRAYGRSQQPKPWSLWRTQQKFPQEKTLQLGPAWKSGAQSCRISSWWSTDVHVQLKSAHLNRQKCET